MFNASISFQKFGVGALPELGRVLMAATMGTARTCSMAKKWSGFVPQNLSAREEWELLEACEAQARAAQEATDAEMDEPEPGDLALIREPDGRITIWLSKIPK